MRTLEQVRQVVAGTQALEFRRAEDDEGRYAWGAQVLQRFGYRQLGRSDRGAVLAAASERLQPCADHSAGVTMDSEGRLVQLLSASQSEYNHQS